MNYSVQPYAMSTFSILEALVVSHAYQWNSALDIMKVRTAVVRSFCVSAIYKSKFDVGDLFREAIFPARGESNCVFDRICRALLHEDPETAI